MTLDERLKGNGYGTLPKGRYPRNYLWEWLAENHPDVLKEYEEWFDGEVRG